LTEFDVVHELPRRILAPLDKTGITFSNYLHENERIRDSLEVFVGLLDMNESLSTADLLINVEKIPNQRDVDSALESVSTHSGDVEVDSVEETVSMGPGLSISNNKAEPIERGGQHSLTGINFIYSDS
jgi:Odorant response abnormal 4-like